MTRPLSLITCILAPAAILLTGLIFAGVYGYHEFPKLASESGRGVIPPGFDLALEKPSNYTIWLHTYSVFDGQAYEHDEKMPPGAFVFITDKRSGKKVTISPPFGSMSKTSNNDSAIVIGKFDTYRATEIEVIGRGFKNTAVISIAESNIGTSMKVIMNFIGIIIGSLSAALFALIVLLHRRNRMLALDGMI